MGATQQTTNSAQCDLYLLQELAEFTDFGTHTQIETVNGLKYYINEFWTSRQRQANRIHEISYRACFKPQLPAFFIHRLTQPGNVVYDPFMGRGTTPVEAALLGRIPYGNDINPLGIAFAEPRINPPPLQEIEQRLKQIPWHDFREIEHEELLEFYHPKTLASIEGLRAWLLARQDEGEIDSLDKWIRMIAINRLTGHSSGFFSVYTMPPNQAVSVNSQKKINERRQQIPPVRKVPNIILKKSKRLLSQNLPSAVEYLFLTEQSHNTHQIPDSSVDLTVTSPPFLHIVQYDSDNWLRCWFLGIDPKSVQISQIKTIADWQEFVARTLSELSRITRNGGYIAFEVGEVLKSTVRLEEIVVAAAEHLPFEILGIMINQQEFTKTSNCWGIVNNSLGTNSNRIVLLRNRK